MVGVALGCGDLDQADGVDTGSESTEGAGTMTAADSANGSTGVSPTTGGSGGASADGTTTDGPPSTTDGSGETTLGVDGGSEDSTSAGDSTSAEDSASAGESTSTGDSTSTGEPAGTSSTGGEPTIEEYEACYDAVDEPECVQLGAACDWDEDECDPSIGEGALCSMYEAQGACNLSPAGCSWNGEKLTCSGE